MIGKVIETFFRHKRLILLPFTLVSLLVALLAYTLVKPEYESAAAIWIDRPRYLAVPDDSNRYLPAAQVQANRVRELLGTRSFLMDIGKQTALAPLIGTQRSEERLQEIVLRGLKLTPSGEHLIGISFRSESPQLALQVVQAVIESYRQRSANDSANQASLSTSFYESAIRQAEEERTKSRDGLRRYVAGNPRLTGIDPLQRSALSGPAALPLIASDPQLAELLSRLDLQDDNLNQLRSSLQQTQMNSAALQQGQDLAFQVVDQPRLPTEATLDRKKLILFAVAGLLAGLALSISLLVVLTAADRTIRDERDIVAIDGRLVGAIPRFRPRRHSKQLGPDLVRRLISHAAGVRLASPEGRG